jgi:uncharacterized Fe-S radical SAM superfamily protein PflX
MRITRRAFIKGAISLGSALVVPDRIIGATGDNADQWSPAYEMLANQGLLAQRVEQTYAIFEECRLCPRQCGVNRLKSEIRIPHPEIRQQHYSANEFDRP